MRWMLPLMCAAAIGVYTPAQAADKSSEFAKGTQVVVVGPITSPPSGLVNEQKMQVAIGPNRTDYTLHFRKAELIGLRGQKIDEDGLDDGQWVRAEGRVMDDPRRIEVTRVQVIAPDQKELKRSAFYRTGYDQGYISSVAGTRQIYPVITGATFSSAPFVMVGRISGDTGPFERTRRVHVKAAGNTWTVHVPKEAAVVDGAGKKISVHDVSDGQWVRISGWRTDDLRMRADRMENLGKDEAFRTGTFFRTEYPLGYLDPITSEESVSTFKISGTVVRVDPEFESVTVRDDAGVEHVLYGETARLLVGGDSSGFAKLRPGTKVTVESRRIETKTR